MNRQSPHREGFLLEPQRLEPSYLSAVEKWLHVKQQSGLCTNTCVITCVKCIDALEVTWSS